ncbi:MAG: transcription antitermination factor NusB [bacterium]
MTARRVSRERLLQALYQFQLTGAWPDLADLRRRDEFAPAGGESEDEPFVQRLLDALQQRLADVDGLIEAASRHWRLARMAAVDLSLIRLATAELLLAVAPTAVVLNEAVELAKLYGTDTSAVFVNGVLDGVVRQLAAAPGGAAAD